MFKEIANTNTTTKRTYTRRRVTSDSSWRRNAKFKNREREKIDRIIDTLQRCNFEKPDPVLIKQKLLLFVQVRALNTVNVIVKKRKVGNGVS